MEFLRSLVPLLPLILPVIGKVLLMIPVVPNKLIPFLNATVASVAKYWFLAGFGILGDPSTAPVPPGGAEPDTLALAGIGALGGKALAILWGCLDAAAAHYFYEGRKAMAAKVGKTSWWEQGKRSIY